MSDWMPGEIERLNAHIKHITTALDAAESDADRLADFVQLVTPILQDEHARLAPIAMRLHAEAVALR